MTPAAKLCVVAATVVDGGVVTMRFDDTRQRPLVGGGYSSLGALGAGAVAWQPLPRPGR